MDYQITAYLKNGQSRQTSYEKLLDSLGLREEYFLAEPLTKGTASQACYVAILLKSQVKDISKVIIYDAEGKQVGAFGLISDLFDEKDPK